MSKVAFGAAERAVLALFKPGEYFEYHGQRYRVKFSGKPTCSDGEPKTDIYVLAENAYGDKREFKISFKKENADFLENKISAKRASQILGENWADIIMASTLSIKQEFYSRPLIYKESYARTECGSITLGWKFEFVNKPGGHLSGRMPLTREQLLDVYSGANLSPDKRNASVDGVKIPNSGVANYVLMYDKISSDTVQKIVNILIPVENYVEMYPDIFFACKALNYRTFSQKYDGNRPLSVYINWRVENGRLTPHFVFDEPLKVGGDAVAKNLLYCLKTLGINNTDQINISNVSCSEIVYGL